MLGLLERMPSMTVMMLVTSILIHRETGGNLTEVLERLSRLIRERFRFQRKVRTLSPPKGGCRPGCWCRCRSCWPR